MIERVRGSAGATLAARNWERILYLTNLTTIVVTVAIYLFPIYDPASIRRLYVVLIGFGVSFLVWTLLDGMAAQASFIANLFHGPGLGWMDIALAVLSFLTLLAAWRLQRLNESTVVVGGLTAVNGLLGIFQIRSAYAVDRIDTPYPDSLSDGADAYTEDSGLSDSTGAESRPGDGTTGWSSGSEQPNGSSPAR